MRGAPGVAVEEDLLRSSLVCTDAKTSRGASCFARCTSARLEASVDAAREVALPHEAHLRPFHAEPVKTIEEGDRFAGDDRARVPVSRRIARRTAADILL